MAVKYTKVSMSDPDEMGMQKYASGFDFGPTQSLTDKYKSIYNYSGEKLQTREEKYSVSHDNIPDRPNLICRCWSVFLTIVCYIGLLVTFPITGWFSFKTVHNYERLVIYRLGRLLSAKGPGMVCVLPCIDRFVKVDLRMKAFSVPPQKILTADNAAIEGGADVFYRVYDPIMSVNCIQDLDNATRNLSQTSLQNHLTKQTLGDIEANRTMLGQLLQESVNRTTKMWGIELSRIEISQIKVVQGPPGVGGQAQSLLNMVTPALFPAGSPNMPQGAEATQPQIMQEMARMAQEKMRDGLIGSSGPAVLDMEGAAPSNSNSLNMKLETPTDLIAAVKWHLSPELVRMFGVVYKFDITGSGGGTYYLDLKNGSGDAGEGEPPGGEADATLTLNIKVMKKILKGDISAFSAYMSNELTVDGDVQGAMQLGKLIDQLK